MSNGELNSLDNTINMRGYFERILQEQDKRYTERFEAQEKAVTAALAAAEKATLTAFIAAKEAVSKAEEAQLRVNVTQNEFRGTLKDQAADLMPRAETQLLVENLAKQIEDLRGTRREGIGLSADVAARFALVILAALTVIVTVYLARHYKSAGAARELMVGMSRRIPADRPPALTTRRNHGTRNPHHDSRDSGDHRRARLDRPPPMNAKNRRQLGRPRGVWEKFLYHVLGLR